MGNLLSQPATRVPNWMRDGHNQMHEAHEILHKLGVMAQLFWSGTTRRMRLAGAFVFIL